MTCAIYNKCDCANVQGSEILNNNRSTCVKPNEKYIFRRKKNACVIFLWEFFKYLKPVSFFCFFSFIGHFFSHSVSRWKKIFIFLLKEKNNCSVSHIEFFLQNIFHDGTRERKSFRTDLENGWKNIYIYLLATHGFRTLGLTWQKINKNKTKLI